MFFEYKRDVQKLEREVARLTQPSLVVIHEVQRSLELLNTVQFLLDESRIKHRFILTGSSARKLRKGGANLLPGRVVQRYLTPLLRRELGDAFDLDRALSVGILPGIHLDTQEGSEILATYVDTYLREEIQADGIVRNLGGFARLLDVLAISSGSWLNYTKLGSDCEVNKETVRSYISVLEDTLLLYRIPSFSSRTTPARKATQRDKIVLFDVGVRNALLKIQGAPATPTERGHQFEQWCLQQALYIAHGFNRDAKLYLCN